MKRIVTLTIVLLLLVSMGIPAFADLDEGDFNDWHVKCGPTGFSFVDSPDYGQDDEDLRDYLEPGTVVWVHSFMPETKKYILVISDESNHKIKGRGIFYVTEDQLNKYFIGETQTFNPEFATKLDKKVECVVTPDVGVVLRQGPDKNYPSFGTIPHNTKLTYRYIFEGREDKGGDYTWGYVTYKGQAGWCCIDYTEEIVTTTETTTESTTDSTAESTAPSAITTTAAPDSEDAAAAVDTETSTTAAQLCWR